MNETPPTRAEADRDAWLDDIYREASGRIAFLLGCSVYTAKELYGHLVEAEAEGLKRAVEDEDYGYVWDQLEAVRQQRRGGITQDVSQPGSI